MMSSLKDRYFMDRKLNEECGVFGVYNVEHACSLAYFGLHTLQHRGQEGCGISCSDDYQINCHKGKGLITEVFNNEWIQQQCGIHAVGHVRYSTAGGNQIENIQPLMVRAHTGHFAVVHNGQIVNAQELKISLENEGSIFQGTSDSEILVHLIQKESGKMIEKIKKAVNKLEGAFAFLILTKDTMYAIRDKNGLRPLSIAKLDDGYCVASETCAFDIVNAEFVKDIKPGEIVRFKKSGIESFMYTEKTQRKMCLMEYVYFARPDSVIEGLNVHNTRKQAGRLLFENENIQADIVIGVPDSSISAAIGYAEVSNVPYEIGLIKNRYVGRTFIQPTQQLRERGVRMKLSAIKSIVQNKIVVMVDDSIVRGTTSKRIVRLLKEAGAKEVHVRIASAPIISPCFYGVDTSSYDELISSKLNIDELCRYIQADTLRFLTVEQMKRAISNDVCDSCFTCKYPTKLYSHQKIINLKEGENNE